MTFPDLKQVTEVIIAFIKNPSKKFLFAVAVTLWFLPLLFPVPETAKLYWYSPAAFSTIFLILSLLSWVGTEIKNTYLKIRGPARARTQFVANLNLMDNLTHELLGALIDKDVVAGKILCLDAVTMGNLFNILKNKGFVDQAVYHQSQYGAQGYANFSSYSYVINEQAFHFLRNEIGLIKRPAVPKKSHETVC